VAIAFFGFAAIVIAISKPTGAILGAANLLPFALALIAVRTESQRPSLWFAVILNALWVALFLFIAVLAVVGQAAMPVIAFAVGVVVAMPCALNVRQLSRRLRAEG
jgi:hypothetical protein